MAAAKGSGLSPAHHPAATAPPAALSFDTRETGSCLASFAAVAAAVVGVASRPTPAIVAATTPAPATPAMTSTALTAADPAPASAVATATGPVTALAVAAATKAASRCRPPVSASILCFLY
jgi:hypothetical protein